MRNNTAMTMQSAEILALDALRFLAADTERLGGFLAATGTGPADLKELAGDPVFLGAVIDYMMQDESLIFLFAESADVAPEALQAARRALPGDTSHDEM